MSKHTFIGHILPERFPFYLENTHTVKAQLFAHAQLSTFRLTIGHAQATIDVETPLKNPDVIELGQIVKHLVSTFLDAQCLETGLPYEFDLVSAVSHETGNVSTFGLNFLGISSEGNAKFEFTHLRLARLHGYFQRALREYRRAISEAADTGFLCRRAVEALLNWYIAKQGGDKKAAGAAFGDKLSIDAKCFDFLRDMAGGARHGKIPLGINVPGISFEQRKECLRLTKAILERFSASFDEGTMTLLKLEAEPLVLEIPDELAQETPFG